MASFIRPGDLGEIPARLIISCFPEVLPAVMRRRGIFPSFLCCQLEPGLVSWFIICFLSKEAQRWFCQCWMKYRVNSLYTGTPCLGKALGDLGMEMSRVLLFLLFFIFFPLMRARSIANVSKVSTTKHWVHLWLEKTAQELICKMWLTCQLSFCPPVLASSLICVVAGNAWLPGTNLKGFCPAGWKWWTGPAATTKTSCCSLKVPTRLFWRSPKSLAGRSIKEKKILKLKVKLAIIAIIVVW